jgi:hypothetical protein
LIQRSQIEPSHFSLKQQNDPGEIDEELGDGAAAESLHGADVSFGKM